MAAVNVIVGKNRILDQISEVLGLIDQRERREPRQRHCEGDNQQDTDDELRHAHTDQDHHRGDMIDGAAALDCRQHPEEETERDVKSESERRQDQGIDGAIGDIVGNRPIGDERAAEVGADRAP